MSTSSQPGGPACKVSKLELAGAGQQSLASRHTRAKTQPQSGRHSHHGQVNANIGAFYPPKRVVVVVPFLAGEAGGVLPVAACAALAADDLPALTR